MDIAKEFATWLEDAGFGTVGTDIFIGHIPESTTGIYVQRTGGELNNYVPIEKTMIDIYSRNPDASSSITTLENIKRFIHRMVDTNTANDIIYAILVLGDIEDLDRDLEYNKLYKVSVEITHRSTDLIS